MIIRLTLAPSLTTSALVLRLIFNTVHSSFITPQMCSVTPLFYALGKTMENVAVVTSVMKPEVRRKRCTDGGT